MICCFVEGGYFRKMHLQACASLLVVEMFCEFKDLLSLLLSLTLLEQLCPSNYDCFCVFESLTNRKLRQTNLVLVASMSSLSSLFIQELIPYLEGVRVFSLHIFLFVDSIFRSLSVSLPVSRVETSDRFSHSLSPTDNMNREGRPNSRANTF